MVQKGKQGKTLERWVDIANQQYIRKGSAFIKKVPTPTKVFKEDRGRIKDGVFTAGEWVDYTGICNGKAIAFDAKETRERTRFDLMKNLHPHQYECLKSYHNHGGKSFLLVCFIKHGYETYILPFEDLEKFYTAALEGGPQSIPYPYFVENCEIVKPHKGIRLHYLLGVI